jgi:acyl-CoA thioesterase YciA
MIAMPADANPSGDIFGGWIMSLMDMAGGQVAYQSGGGRVVTVAVDEIVFHVPVAVGDEVSCYAGVVRTGRTSIRTHVEVWTRRRGGGLPFKVTEGDYTYVLVDQDGRPTPLPANMQRRSPRDS